MFCSKCGAEVPQESKVCSNCGAPIEVGEENGFQVDLTQAVTVTPEAVAQPIEKGEMLSKSKYISQLAPKKVKVFSIISLVLTFVMIASLAFGAYTAVSTSIEKTPIGSALFLITGADSDEVDQLKEQIAVGIEDAKEQLDKHEDKFDAKELKVLNETIEILEDCQENISIQNVYDISKQIEKLQDLVTDSKGETDAVGATVSSSAVATVEDAKATEGTTASLAGSDFGIPSSATSIIALIYYFILGCFAFALIFSIFGGFFKRTGLIITGMIFAILFSLIFSGIIATLIVTLVHSLLIGFTASVNGSYKEYKRSF